MANYLDQFWWANHDAKRPDCQPWSPQVPPSMKKTRVPTWQNTVWFFRFTRYLVSTYKKWTGKSPFLRGKSRINGPCSSSQNCKRLPGRVNMLPTENPLWICLSNHHHFFHGHLDVGSCWNPKNLGVSKNGSWLSREYDVSKMVRIPDFQTAIDLSKLYHWLVVWNHGILWLSIQLGMSLSQLTNSYFSEGLKPPTSKLYQK